MKFSAPSKTFLIGEYGVLTQGPALLLNTEPRFSLAITPAETPQLIGIDSRSPAGKFYHTHENVFSPYQCTFYDPHQQCGGLGASSAQFLLLLRAYSELTQQSELTPAEILNYYQRVAWDGTGVAPSGADVIGQTFGHITYWEPHAQTATSLAWPFADISFALIYTGHKIASHEHLHALQLPELTLLHTATQDAYRALVDKNSQEFIGALHTAAEFLATQELVAKTTLTLLHACQQLPGILAAKGCGALGADVVLVILEPTAFATLHAWLATTHSHYLADQETLAAGLQPQFSCINTQG